jgi:membrane peptidoglycan carboxypeptidase
MKLDTNTVFADIAFNTVGTKGIARSAIEAGIPATVGNKGIPLAGTPGQAPSIAIAIGGDVTQARPVDIAGSFATFAANGTKHTPHLISKVTGSDNKVVLDGDNAHQATPAFNESDIDNNADIARNVTESLLPVPGAVRLPCANNRPCAAKPGSHGCPTDSPKTTKADLCTVWMAGYTPQVSTAVVIATDDASALKTTDGAPIEATGMPGQVWKTFMDSYLADKPVLQFPPFKVIGRTS